MASEDEKFQAVVKAEMRISKAEEMRKETELIMKPYANWEEYLMPAPLSVAILGQLICISTGQGDFSVNKNPPPKGFRYIRYPESFRACLAQVSNEGWHAFNKADNNMDQIRLFTGSIPEKMKLMVQTLFQDVEVANALLPGQLKSMKSIADNCSTLAHGVKEKYENVIFLIQELLEACTNAKTGYEEERKKVQLALKQAKIREEAAKKNMQLVTEYHEAMKKQVEESFSRYKKAMDNVPSGWDAVGMMIVEGLGNAVVNLANSIPSLLQNKYEGSAEGSPPGSHIPNSQRFSAMTICNFSSTILTLASGIKENVVKENGLNFEEVYDKKTEQVKINWVKKGFLDLKNDINKEENCQAKEKALKIVLDGVQICEQLEHLAKSAKTEEKEEEEEEEEQEEEEEEEESAIVEKINDLYNQAATFDSYSKATLGTSGFTPKSPNMAKSQQELTGGSIGMKNAHLKVEQSREMYKAAQEEYQKSFEKFKEQNKELAEILTQMEDINIKKIDFEAALKMLTEGLKAMGKVKEQWEKMIQFFEMIVSIIDARLKQNISDFLEFVSGVQEIKGYSSKSFVIDTIYNHVFNASPVAHLVHMIAETYTEVSKKYLMDRVSRLGRLLTLESTDPEFNSEREALRQNCEEARKAIFNLVVEKKEEFDGGLLARMETIERELKAVLPPISVEEKKMIEKAVHDGRKQLTKSEEDQFA